MQVSIHPVIQSQRSGRPAGRIARTCSVPVVEPLEGRALLSAIHGLGGARPVPAHVRTPGGPHAHTGLLYRGPVIEGIINGTVAKHPEFYELYKGPKLASLDAIGATGHFTRSSGFAFTGQLLGPIDPAQPALYTFLVDRGGAKAPGPFPNRADIFFDSLVIVATGPAGVSGKVVLLDSSGKPTSSTDLPAGAVHVQDNQVSTAVDPKLLPSTSKDKRFLQLGEYRYTFSPQLKLGDPPLIASFAPEYTNAPVAAHL